MVCRSCRCLWARLLEQEYIDWPEELECTLTMTSRSNQIRQRGNKELHDRDWSRGQRWGRWQWRQRRVPSLWRWWCRWWKRWHQLQTTVKPCYSAPAYNIIPLIELKIFSPKTYFHNHLHVGNNKNYSIEHNFDMSLQMRYSRVQLYSAIESNPFEEKTQLSKNHHFFY